MQDVKVEKYSLTSIVKATYTPTALARGDSWEFPSLISTGSKDRIEENPYSAMI